MNWNNSSPERLNFGMQQFWRNKLMLLCFCSLHLICPFYLHPVQQQSGMNVPVSLLQDTFFSLSSSVTVSCLFERPFTPNSPAPFSLTACSQLTFLPIAWFCLLSMLCPDTFNYFWVPSIFFQRVWQVRKFCQIICKAARGMKHQLFARIFVSVKPSTWINLFRAVKSRKSWDICQPGPIPSPTAGEQGKPGDCDQIQPRF